MSKSNAFETAFLQHVFLGSTINGLSGPATSPSTGLYVSLHTGSPGETGNQGTNECTYGPYARIQVSRSSSGWAVSGNTAKPAATITFAEASSGSETATYFGIGRASSGAGTLYYYGTLTPNITIAAGVTPSVSTASAITED